MKKNNIKNDITILISIFSMLSLIYCSYSYIGIESSIYILPGFYFFLNLIFLSISQNSLSLPIVLIRITSFIRYVIVPVSYCSDFNNTTYKMDSLVYILMFIDIASSFFTIFLICKLKHNKPLKKIIENTNRKSKTVIGITTMGISFIALYIFVKNPVLVQNAFSLNLSNRVEIKEMWGLFQIIVNTFFVIAFIQILLFINKNNLKKIKLNIGLSIGASVLFINSVYSSSTGNISRWSIVINLLIIVMLLGQLYPKYSSKMSITFIITLPILLLISTYYKFLYRYGDLLSRTDVIKVIDDILSYKMLNAYFSGPTNVQFAIKAAHYYRESISIFTFVNDIFANFPLLNKYLSNSQDITPYYFNYIIYNSTVAKDQIAPLIGQSYMLFGLIFTPFLTCLFTYLAIKFYRLSLKSDNILYQYCILTGSIVCSLQMCLNLNIILQYMWIKVLPIYLILLFNYKINFRNNTVLRNELNL